MYSRNAEHKLYVNRLYLYQRLLMRIWMEYSLPARYNEVTDSIFHNQNTSNLWGMIYFTTNPPRFILYMTRVCGYETEVHENFTAEIIQCLRLVLVT